jgi:hypothetical protein
MDLIDQIYQQGDGIDYGLSLGLRINSQEPIVAFMTNFLTSLIIRSDYNGRPLAWRTPKGRIILRTHPFYSTHTDHYGRVYEYRLIDEEGSVSSGFYACVYENASFDNDIEAMLDEGTKTQLDYQQISESMSNEQAKEIIREGNVEGNTVGYLYIDGIWWLISG